MLFFENDYSAGAHEAILEKMAQINRENNPGYGSDRYCESAKQKIRTACGAPEADVFFLVGGTQTNETVITAMLKNYQGVVAAETGHVGVHEAGAIEHTGHKVLTLPEHDGKLNAAELECYLAEFFADENRDHMVFPGMVYISYPTELGTLYSKAELGALHDVCGKFSLPLFIDGARLGYGLMSDEADLTLPELAALCDVFYIGGTKMGALFGEAVVFPRGDAPAHFLTTVKQHGALLAKGWLLGLQFDVLFTDDLYFRLGRHAILQAKRLKEILQQKGLELFCDSPTNQQFVVLENSVIAELGKKVAMCYWCKVDETRSAVRFATGWATDPQSVEALEALL